MSINSKLRAIAHQLPTLPRVNKNGVIQTYSENVKVKGEKILKLVPDAKDKSGNPIESDKFYINTVTKNYPSDHFKELKEMYHANGEDGVNTYIQICFDYNKSINPGIKF